MSWSKFGNAIKRALLAFVSGSLWIVVLVPILGVSGYSLYFVTRYLGAPWYVAGAVSTCFDGVALLAADYSLKYAQEGLAGTMPRFVVRVFALLGSGLQTLHARIGHEPPGSWILWAALPWGAVLVYEIHIRWARRKALAKAGHIYPKPLPSFGLVTWVLFPFSTLDELRKVVKDRRVALVRAAQTARLVDVTNAEPPARVVRHRDTAPKAAPPVTPTATAASPQAQPESHVVVTQDEVAQHRAQRKVSAHSPTRHIRDWAKSQGIYGKVPDRARLKAQILNDYYRAHPDEERVV